MGAMSQLIEKGSGRLSRLFYACICVVGVVAALFFYLLIGQNGGAQGQGPPETISNAKVAIEGLPHPFIFSTPPRDSKRALIVRLEDMLGERFRFFVFVGHAPARLGVPGYHRKNLDASALGKSYVMLSRGYISGESRAEEDERFTIENEVEDSLCELSEGSACPL
jgi:hypothetical protein